MGVVAFVEQNVAGLHVAVQDTLGVDRGQPGEDLAAHGGGLLWGHGPVVGEHRGERPRRHQSHHQPRLVVLVDQVVHGHDVGVAHLRADLRLAPHPVLVVGVDLLDGHLSAQQVVLRRPHDTHAARPDSVEQPVPACQQISPVKDHRHKIPGRGES